MLKCLEDSKATNSLFYWQIKQRIGMITNEVYEKNTYKKFEYAKNCKQLYGEVEDQDTKNTLTNLVYMLKSSMECSVRQNEK